MLIFMPTISFSMEKTDSIMEKVWSYRKNFGHKVEGRKVNTYLRYTLNAERRNPTMFLVPTLHSFAKGERQFISEIYGRLELKDEHDNSFKQQIISSTIPHNRQVSDVFTEHLTPTLYDMTIYNEKILSPFHRTNRIYYRYQVEDDSSNYVKLSFRPKWKSTQLIKGYAMVDPKTGRIINAIIDGEYNMIKFHVDVALGLYYLFPQRCKADMEFSFLGNHLTSHFISTYNSPTTLPDSLRRVNDRNRMNSLRTVKLGKDEQEIYRRYDEKQRKKSESKEKKDTTEEKKNKIEDVLLDIGDRLVSSSHANSGEASFSLSPIINPQYLSYSHSRGVSYKIQLGARYNWNEKRYLTIQPQIGYNFGIHQLYHRTPIRMTYNPKRNGYAEVIIANGNRISNSSVLQVVREEFNNEAEGYEHMELDYFTDNYIQAHNNVVAYDWVEIDAGLVYHIRKPKNVSGMLEFDQPIIFRSFAPTLTLHVSPWRRGPFFTMNYERSFKGILKSTLEYERFEFDVSHKFKMSRLRFLNLKGGFGLYTNQKTSYFLDYANFHDENLPGGWEDEWTGNFQLVNSDWYNMSNYYVRLNTSYDSPLLLLSFLPWIGKPIEKERFYFSMLSIQHTHAYSEIGYSASTRFISIGAFASFLNTKFQDFGLKFTFELFRTW